jgi:hypothetical protein
VTPSHHQQAAQPPTHGQQMLGRVQGARVP